MNSCTRGLLIVSLAAALAALGCAKEPAPLPGAGASGTGDDAAQGSLPSGHPPISSPAPMGGSAPEATGERPLKPDGIGSMVELNHCLAKIQDAAMKARFEEGFRACFTSNQGDRDYRIAADAANEILGKLPNFAPAYRMLAYARLNTGFDMQGATELYEKAIEADPDYGEAHYALSFMLTKTDPERGRKHFEKAMELGIPDERDLRSRFYPTSSSPGM